MLKNKWKELLVITQIESLYQLHTTSFHYNKYQLRKGRGGERICSFSFNMLFHILHISLTIFLPLKTYQVPFSFCLLASTLHLYEFSLAYYSTYLHKQKNWNWWKSFSTLCAAPLCCARHLVFLQTSLEEWRKPTRT